MDLELNLEKPSFFELIAQQQLTSLFKPALEYLFSYISQFYPRFYSLVKWNDEFFCLCSFFLERYFLKNYGASFSENFYGLKRLKQSSSNKFIDYNKKKIRSSLLLLILFPYIKLKLEKYYEKLKNQQDEFNIYETEENNSTFKKIFVSSYPILNTFFEASSFFYQIGYISNKTNFFSLLYKLDKSVLSRLSLEEQEEQEMFSEYKLQQLPFPSFILQILRASKLFLPGCIYIFRFLEWWYTEYTTEKTQIYIPTSPPIPEIAEGGYPVPKKDNICPLCLKEISNAAVSTGGYAFCYLCLFNYVETEQKCPVTFLSNKPEQIRKVYETL